MSEIKTSTVKEVLSCKRFDGKHGVVYYHKLELDNGEIGEIGKKTENAFKPGDSLTYTSETGEYGTKFKAAQLDGGYAPRSNGNGSFPTGEDRNRSFALSYAKDLTVALIAKADHPYKSDDVVKVTRHIADGLLAWLNEGK